MFNYRRRVEQDLATWQHQGWVSPDGAANISHDLANRQSRLDLASSLGILGAILIGFAIISFVAANWPNLSKLSKLVLIASVLLGCYGVAITLFRRKLDGLAHAALLGGSLAYGGGIMLIAQIYHLAGHAPDAVWLWGVGALIAGAVIPSNPTLALALVLFTLWSGMEVTNDRSHAIHWAFLPVWAATALGFARARWRPGLHLASLALSCWIIMVGFTVKSGGHAVVTMIGVAICAVSIAFGPAIDRLRVISGTMLCYGLGLAFAGIFALQFMTGSISTVRLLMLGALTLLALIAVIFWAWRTDNRAALWIAYSAFSIEIFALYVNKLGSLMDTSAFFLIAGLMVIALANVAVRLHRAQTLNTVGSAPL
jgi:uncharacterized membrane protein